MATNRRIVDSTNDNFYPTPPWCTRALMDHEDLGSSIWEPACGTGWMSEELKRGGYTVFSSDLVDRGYSYVSDFLLTDPRPNVDSVVTNPPYSNGLAEAFVHKGLKAARKKVCMLMRLAFLEGSGRYNSLYSITPPHRVWVFSERITFYPNGLQTAGSGTTAFAWYVWDVPNIHEPHATEIKWIPPGYKNSDKRRTV